MSDQFHHPGRSGGESRASRRAGRADPASRDGHPRRALPAAAWRTDIPHARGHPHSARNFFVGSLSPSSEAEFRAIPLEASALSRTAVSPQALLGHSPLLRLQSDEKLVAMTRRGHPGAFEALVHRYQARLHSFCRHMLGSTEDAEDVLQESFASAHRAMIADERPIVARAWLYRIARNRCLDHLRRPAKADGQDSMDVFERGCGVSSEDLGSSRGAASPTGAARPRRVARAPADGPPADRSRRPADRPRRAVNRPRRAAAPRLRRASAQVPSDPPRTARRAPRVAPIDRRARPGTRPRRRALGSEGRRAPQPDAAT